MRRILTYLEGQPMNKITLTVFALMLSAGLAFAFPETSSMNNENMQTLQNLDRFKTGNYNEFKSFKKQQKENQERIKKDIERQQQLEQRAEQAPTHSKFVNDNGVIRIENGY